MKKKGNSRIEFQNGGLRGKEKRGKIGQVALLEDNHHKELVGSPLGYRTHLILILNK